MPNEDSARREFILNILLAASIFLIFFGIFLHIAVVAFHFFDAAYQNNTISLGVEIILLLFFISLYILSRRGFFRFASYMLLASFFLLAAYMTLRWGVEVQVALLFYVLIIVMAGVLIGTRFAFIATIISTLNLAFFVFLQNLNFVHPNRYWVAERAGLTDVLMFFIIFFVIATVSWLSNREIEKSLARARKSEAELKLERDSLEMRVEERTAELKKTQMEQVSQLYRFAEFGKLSSGLFHDLVNLLTAASLNMDQIKDNHPLALAGMEPHFDRAATAIKRMENFIIAIRKQMGRQKTEIQFSLTDRINSVIQILEFKARKANVKISFSPAEGILLYGDPTKFSQIVLNLITNAVDSYSGMNDAKERKVEISLSVEKGAVQLRAQDWGCGIAPEIAGKIFEPFFTTKGADMGTGIGLSLTKDVVERDFGGVIKCESKANEGSKFTVIFPINNK